MKLSFSIVPVALVLALAATPAMAQWERHHQRQSYSQPYAYEPESNWNNRGIADPSFGNRAGINNARTYNRCVIDLGYGRYEYCN